MLTFSKIEWYDACFVLRWQSVQISIWPIKSKRSTQMSNFASSIRAHYKSLFNIHFCRTLRHIISQSNRRHYCKRLFYDWRRITTPSKVFHSTEGYCHHFIVVLCKLPVFFSLSLCLQKIRDFYFSFSPVSSSLPPGISCTWHEKFALSTTEEPCCHAPSTVLNSQFMIILGNISVKRKGEKWDLKDFYLRGGIEKTLGYFKNVMVVRGLSWTAHKNYSIKICHWFWKLREGFNSGLRLNKSSKATAKRHPLF